MIPSQHDKQQENVQFLAISSKQQDELLQLPGSIAYSFADYRLEAEERRLLHQGALVFLTPKVFDLLLILVEHAGQLVRKDELLRILWPDRFVEESNLSVCVSSLRKLFRQHSPAEKFIETVPKAGYRFCVPVNRVSVVAILDPCIETRESQTAHPVPIGAADIPWFKKHGVAAGSVLLLLLFTTIVAQRYIIQGGLFQESKTLANSKALANSRPLMAPSGNFSQPAFSFDGRRVAYIWSPFTTNQERVYMQAVDSSQRMEMPETDGVDYSPAWAPASNLLAWLHSTGEERPMALMVASLAAPSHLRQLATIYGDFRVPPKLTWSRDGEWLLTTDRVSNRDSPSIVLIDLKTGQKRFLTHAPLRTSDDEASLSPNGKWLAFRRLLGSSIDAIYVVPINGGQERRLPLELHSGISGIAWNPDGRSLLVSAGRATSVGNLWRVPIDGGEAIPITPPLMHISDPAISPEAHRLAYVEDSSKVSIWQVSVNNQVEPSRIIASDFFDSAADYSPDGSQIAFRSDRSGANEIWICDRDGKNARKLTDFRGPMTGSPRWSPDKRWIAFDSRAGARSDIYIISSAGGKPARITFGSSSDFDNVVPSWSHDSKSVYFSSNRTGQWQLWRRDLNSGSEVQLTWNGGFNAIESPDGNYLYYVRDLSKTSIWRMPMHGNQMEESIVPALGTEMWGSWTVSRSNLYYLQRVSAASTKAVLYRLSLAGRHAKCILLTQYAVNSADRAIAVSPDERTILLSLLSVDRSSISIVDGWK
jgi:Tol biopolymer transport system component/DNA-binding winged helix-turn-helix (wHTH) protein